MNALEVLAGLDWWTVAGWTMLHYLWLGLAVGVAAGASRFVLRRASAHVRYVVAVSCLMTLAVLPVGIGIGVGLQASGVREVADGGMSIDQGAIDLAPRPAPVSAGGIAEPARSEGSMETELVSEPLRIERSDIGANPRQSRGLTAVFDLIPYVEIAAGWLPWVWIVGAPVTFLMLATGVVGAERLRRESRQLVDGPVVECLERSRALLAIGRRVAVAVCERVAAPVLVGIVRPMILLPPAALTGWSPDEIEMVLLHELAHVRRWDNLVNLVQRLVEAVLFFQPAVWLVSGWVRREREACCDAVVVGATQRPREYAELLVELAAQMFEADEAGHDRPRLNIFTRGQTNAARRCPRPGSLVSAMAAGPLRGRIRRILGFEDDPMLVSGKSLGVVMSSLLLATTLVVLNLPTRSEAEQKTGLATEDTESTEDKADLAKQRAATLNNLKDVMLAILNYEAATHYFPTRARFDASGKPLLSWRVLILPYLGEEEAKLYAEFRLNEPWDSEHNRKLLARMPAAFKNPRIDRPGFTNYLAVVGEACMFNADDKPVQLKHVTDGISRTIALVEADVDRAVEWTKPSDWKFDRERPTAGLGGLWPKGWYGAYVDGSISLVSNSESPDHVGIEFTRGGGETASLAESAGLAVGVMIAGTDDGTRYGMAGEMMGNRGAELGMAGGEFGGEMGVESTPATGTAMTRFPTLEEQKVADVAWERLGLELEAIDDAELKRVQALGYEGGLRISGSRDAMRRSVDFIAPNFAAGEILVGLHVWPTRNLQDVAAVLRRDDLEQLNPLKFYSVRQEAIANEGLGGRGRGDQVTWKDRVRSGRISVMTKSRREGNAKPATTARPAERPPVNAAEIAALREHVEILKRQFRKVDDQYRDGAKHVGPMLDMTAYELALSEGELLLAVGSHEAALIRFRDASKKAEAALQSVTKEYEANRITQDALLQAARNVRDIKRKILQLDNAPATMQTPGRTPASSSRDGQSGSIQWPTAESTDVKLPVPTIPHAVASQPIPLGSAEKSNSAAALDPRIEQKLAENPVLQMMQQELMSLEYQLQEQAKRTKNADTREIERLKLQIAAKRKIFEANRKQLQEILTSANRSKSALRYDGKTFHEWRTEWQTELSTEKRIESVKALAAFGRAGYGKEAAAVILDVAGEYDFTFMRQDDDPEGKFKQNVIQVLAPESGRPSLAEYWLPDLVARMKDDPGKWAPLLAYAVGQLRTDKPPVIGLLRTLAGEGPAEVRSEALGALVRSERVSDRTGKLSEESRKLLGAALASSDPARNRSALWLLVYDANNPRATVGGGMVKPQLLYLPELVAPLFSTDEGVRQQARLQLPHIQAKDATALLEQLLKVLDDDSRAEEHVEAIRAIAAMGPAAVAAAPELSKIVSESKDENAIVAALFASACINDKDVAMNLVHGSLNTRNLLETVSSAIHPLLTPNNPQVDALGKKLNEIDGLQQRLEREAEVIFPESRPRSGGGMF